MLNKHLLTEVALNQQVHHPKLHTNDNVLEQAYEAQTIVSSDHYRNVIYQSELRIHHHQGYALFFIFFPFLLQ